MLDVASFESPFTALVFTTPRIMSALSISPFFGPQFIQGTARQVVIIALSITAVGPVMGEPIPTEIRENWAFYAGAILAKEVAFGLLLGFATGLVFWLAEGVGFFIDNQRGSSMAEMVDPMSGSGSSPFGILMTKIIGVLFFLGGGFHAFLSVLYDSYVLWPVFSFLPEFGPAFPTTCLNILDSLMAGVVTYAAPIVLAMFLAEFGLGLMNRFSPQLNVFFLAMPVKSGIAALMIIFYLTFLVGFLQEHIMTPGKMKGLYEALFD